MTRRFVRFRRTYLHVERDGRKASSASHDGLFFYFFTKCRMPAGLLLKFLVVKMYILLHAGWPFT
jgi:hypothetical protein